MTSSVNLTGHGRSQTGDVRPLDDACGGILNPLVIRWSVAQGEDEALLGVLDAVLQVQQ